MYLLPAAEDSVLMETAAAIFQNSLAWCRLVWALVHSKRRQDTGAGLQLADVLLQSDDLDNPSKQDLIYLRCVALYRLGNYLGVRDQLEEFLKVPSCSFSHAISLVTRVELPSSCPIIAPLCSGLVNHSRFW